MIERNTTIQNVQDHAFLASNLHLQAQVGAVEPAMATARGAAPAITVGDPVTTPDPAQIRLLQDALAKGLLG